ncbi:MAG: hypothetical protein IKG70_01240 [Lachnospiraceae bacterium]|nr:hypothetical protein [Lachnospiraceae bacterium]
MNNIDNSLLERIDRISLSPANTAWREAVRTASWHIHADRERWTVKSWLETEGEDLEIRRAKLLKCVLDNLTIDILPFDQIVARATPSVIGCATAMDIAGDYIPAIWNEDGVVDATMDASVKIDNESLEILRTAARTFGGKSAPDMSYKAWEAAMGSWGRDAEDAKLKDPSLDASVYGQVTTSLNWDKIVKVGLRSYIDEAKAHLEEFRSGTDTDINKAYFWEAAIIVLEAVIDHAHRYADLAREKAAAEEDGFRKKQLLEIAEICEYVPENAPRTFQEALQLMSFCGVAKIMEHPMHGNPHWGRADQYLYPFFKKDIENGTITVERAAELIADLIGRWGTQCFVQPKSQKLSHQINFCINNIMVGGVNADGTDASNELSYLILHVVGLLKISSPTVGLKWSRVTPDWLIKKAIRTNIETKGGIPLFENDDVVIDHYVKDGISYKDAVEWSGLGCVYPCIPTRAEHTGAHGLGAFNVAGCLHLALHNGIDINGKQTGLATGDPRTFKSFEELYDAFLKQHKNLSHRCFRLGNIARRIEKDYIRLPLISALGLQFCMDAGRDTVDADPDHMLQGIGDRGIIDAADSLEAIRYLVFDKKLLSMEELMDALENDFSGERGEEIRQLCLKAPKFGNDIEEADLMARRVSDDSARIIHSYDNSPFNKIMIAREGLAWHYFGGLGVGALPNGRKALEPLDDGSISPMRGMDTNGPTAVLHSVLTAQFKDSYAQVLNQKFSAALLKDEQGIDKLVAYTKAFMAAGGTHIQYNIMDSEQLKEAKVKPEDNKDLIVRIGGFSAYFVQLSNEIQDDVIYRSEMEL